VIHFDSSFVIDLHREIAKERPGDAFAFIESLDATELLAVSVHVLCELRAGAELARHPLREHELVDDLIGSFAVSYPDDRFAPAYGRLLADSGGLSRPLWRASAGTGPFERTSPVYGSAQSAQRLGRS
jgi:predicted nucleic acid-binding protein